MEEDRYIRITLRIPKDLHFKLHWFAEETSKSMNAEIVYRLEQSFKSSPNEQLLSDKAVLSAVIQNQETLIKSLSSLIKTVIESKPVPDSELKEATALIIKALGAVDERTDALLKLVKTDHADST
ncbi:MAG: type II toxin-antitoxin system HicB family antitoxin [Burkholderiaceae bacterium]|nr:type II toxin-antitoxin system HicB family antitoxin [Burkholderiaceae bacterium]